MSGRSPRMVDVLQRMLDDDRADLHVALPGKVTSYDAATQTATIQPMVKRVVREGFDETRVTDDLPPIAAVPVIWPQGGGYFLTFPLAAGDGGLLVFCERDIGSWRDSGQIADPGDEGLHTLAGAVFLPGLETTARTAAGSAHAVLGKTGGPSIHIDGSTAQIGGAGGTELILASEDFISWMSAVTTATGAPAPVNHIATKAKGT